MYTHLPNISGVAQPSTSPGQSDRQDFAWVNPGLLTRLELYCRFPNHPLPL